MLGQADLESGYQVGPYRAFLVILMKKKIHFDKDLGSHWLSNMSDPTVPGFGTMSTPKFLSAIIIQYSLT